MSTLSFLAELSPRCLCISHNPKTILKTQSQALTVQKISNLLDEVFKHLVGVLKELFLALGFIKSVLGLGLHSLGECSNVSELRVKQRLFRLFQKHTCTAHAHTDTHLPF